MAAVSDASIAFDTTAGGASDVVSDDPQRCSSRTAPTMMPITMARLAQPFSSRDDDAGLDPMTVPHLNRDQCRTAARHEQSPRNEPPQIRRANLRTHLHNANLVHHLPLENT